MEHSEKCKECKKTNTPNEMRECGKCNCLKCEFSVDENSKCYSCMDYFR